MKPGEIYRVRRQTVFLKQNDGFGHIDPKDDLLHPEQNALIKADSLTETQYFGFSVPEANIHALTYQPVTDCEKACFIAPGSVAYYIIRNIRQQMPQQVA